MNTIKDARLCLVSWGNYWKSKSYGKGLPRSSSINLIGQSFSQSTLYLSDSIVVPASVAVIDNIFAALTTSQQSALRAKYKMAGKATDNAQRLGLNRKSFNHYLSRAEIRVMIELDNY